MYSFNVDYLDHNSKIQKEEFDSPSPYIDLTTLSHMQIHLNTILGGYENASAVGIITITPINLSNYEMKEVEDVKELDILDSSVRSYTFETLRMKIYTIMPSILKINNISSKMISAWLLGIYNILPTMENIATLGKLNGLNFINERTFKWLESNTDSEHDKMEQSSLKDSVHVRDDGCTHLSTDIANAHILGRYKIVLFNGCLDWLSKLPTEREYMAKIAQYMEDKKHLI